MELPLLHTVLQTLRPDSDPYKPLMVSMAVSVSTSHKNPYNFRSMLGPLTPGNSHIP